FASCLCGPEVLFPIAPDARLKRSSRPTVSLSSPRAFYRPRRVSIPTRTLPPAGVLTDDFAPAHTPILLAAIAGPASPPLSKAPHLVPLFKPVVEKASESTVRIKCDDKDCALGTVVDPNGLILTKLSELKGAIYVRLPDGSEYEGTRVAEHKDTDLALLKVD